MLTIHDTNVINKNKDILTRKVKKKTEDKKKLHKVERKTTGKVFHNIKQIIRKRKDF